MLVLPIFLPAFLVSLIDAAVIDFRQRLTTIDMKAIDVLATTRFGDISVEVGARVHFETTPQGRFSGLRLDLSLPIEPVDDRQPHIYLSESQESRAVAEELKAEFADLFVRHEVQRRMKDWGRELAHLTPKQLDEVIEATEGAASNYRRHTSRLDEWVLHEMAVAEEAIRAVSNHAWAAAYEKAKPLGKMLAVEAERSRLWWEHLSDSGRNTWSAHVPSAASEAERMVLAYRHHLRFMEDQAADYEEHARHLRAIYQLLPAG